MTSVDPSFTTISRARIRKLRSLGWPLQKIADRLGVSKSTVGRSLLPSDHPPQARQPRDGERLPCACAECTELNHQMIDALREMLGKGPLYAPERNFEPPRHTRSRGARAAASSGRL